MNYESDRKFNAFAEIPQPLLDGIAKVTIAWSRLDYVLRIALKRIRDVGMDSGVGKAIFEKKSHGCVVDEIKDEIKAECKSNSKLDKYSRNEIEKLVDSVRASRDDSIYGRRNGVIHSLWWATSDGTWLAYRVGGKDSTSKKVTEEDLDGIVKDIDRVAYQLLNLTDRLVGLDGNGNPSTTTSSENTAPRDVPVSAPYVSCRSSGVTRR